MKALTFNVQSTLLLIGLALSTTSHAMPSRGIGWGGYYIGAYSGAGAGGARTEINSHSQGSVFFVDPTPSSPFTQLLFQTNSNFSGTVKGKVSGSFADLFAGYNFYEPGYNLVLGAQLEGSIFSDITWKPRGLVERTNDGINLFINSDGVITLFARQSVLSNQEIVDRLRSKFALVGRVGYLIQPCTLIYGLGGPVAGHFVLPAFDLLGVGIDDAHKNLWELGYTVGAGLELKMNDHWSLRGEYRYLSFNIHRSINTQFDSTSINLIDDLDFTFLSFPNNQKANTKFHDHLGEIGIVYSF